MYKLFINRYSDHQLDTLASIVLWLLRMLTQFVLLLILLVPKRCKFGVSTRFQGRMSPLHSKGDWECLLWICIREEALTTFTKQAPLESRGSLWACALVTYAVQDFPVPISYWSSPQLPAQHSLGFLCSSDWSPLLTPGNVDKWWNWHQCIGSYVHTGNA